MSTRLAMSVAMLALTVGCSSGGGGGGTSGAQSLPASIDGSKQVVDATDADKAAACDWFAGLVGGYGAAASCTGVVLSAPPSQADCVASFPTCDVTFTEFANCVVAVTDAQKVQPCDATAVQTAATSTTCGAVPVSCFGTTN